ncbi:uncharacterized protein LOC105388902 [Plutella xylostella]|uniref:uncharacterized protein LOC105388902 n=1 Tax=Plutella xylostella TaxID=51655 RepID=UPI002032DA7C|nr:uncharacterized protein LOC105388902 [Plutella xylostella]
MKLLWLLLHSLFAMGRLFKLPELLSENLRLGQCLAESAESMDKTKILRITDLDPGFEVEWKPQEMLGDEPVMGYRIVIWEILPRNTFPSKEMSAPIESEHFFGYGETLPKWVKYYDPNLTGHATPFKELIVNGQASSVAQFRSVQPGVFYEVRVQAVSESLFGPMSDTLAIKFADTPEDAEKYAPVPKNKTSGTTTTEEPICPECHTQEECSGCQSCRECNRCPVCDQCRVCHPTCERKDQKGDDECTESEECNQIPDVCNKPDDPDDEPSALCPEDRTTTKKPKSTKTKKPKSTKKPKNRGKTEGTRKPNNRKPGDRRRPSDRTKPDDQRDDRPRDRKKPKDHRDDRPRDRKKPEDQRDDRPSDRKKPDDQRDVTCGEPCGPFESRHDKKKKKSKTPQWKILGLRMTDGRIV